jgi:transcription-repair coupling factor (superfamily II helicase)
MREAVAEIRGHKTEGYNEASVEIKINAYVPPSYISDEIQRIEVYKKIAAVDGLNSAKAMREELHDRYGSVPKTVESLILISLIKSFASRAGIASVTKNGRAFVLKYGEDSRISVKSLLKVLDEYSETAQLRSAEPPFIMFAPREHVMDSLLKFLKDIRRCIIH